VALGVSVTSQEKHMRLRHPFYLEKHHETGQWLVMAGWSGYNATKFKVVAYVVMWAVAIHYVLVRKFKHGDPIWEK